MRLKNACLKSCLGVGLRHEEFVVAEAALEIRVVGCNFEMRAFAVTAEALHVKIQSVIVFLVTVDDKYGKTIVLLIPCAGTVDVIEALFAGVLRSVVNRIAGDIKGFAVNANLHGSALCVVEHRHECVVGSGAPYMVVV